MKKILGGVLVVLSVLLVGNLKAETLEEPGSRDITATISSIEYPVYSIELTWEAFEYSYDISGLGTGYIWNGNPKVTIVNSSSVAISTSFNWESSINGVGMLMMTTTDGPGDTNGELWCDSLTEGTTFYSDYYDMSGEGTANGLLNSMSFIITADNSKFLLSGDGEMIYAPESSDEDFEFNFSLIDTQRKRDLNTLEVNQTIGTLTITIDEVE